MTNYNQTLPESTIKLAKVLHRSLERLPWLHLALLVVLTDLWLAHWTRVHLKLCLLRVESRQQEKVAHLWKRFSKQKQCLPNRMHICQHCQRWRRQWPLVSLRVQWNCSGLTSIWPRLLVRFTQMPRKRKNIIKREERKNLNLHYNYNHKQRLLKSLHVEQMCWTSRVRMKKMRQWTKLLN